MPRLIYDKAAMIADWKTGKYTERDIASKHRVSPGTAHNVVKGIEKTLGVLIGNQVAINQELSELNEHELSRFKEEVDQRTKQIAFFNTAAMRNVTQAMKKPCLDQQDHKFRAETIAKGREVVLGKEPLAVVNNMPQLKTVTIIPAENEC